MLRLFGRFVGGRRALHGVMRDTVVIAKQPIYAGQLITSGLEFESKVIKTRLLVMLDDTHAVAYDSLEEWRADFNQRLEAAKLLNINVHLAFAMSANDHLG